MGEAKQIPPQDEKERNRAIRQFVLGRVQMVSATVRLYFLATTGVSNITIVTAIIAVLLTTLSLTFKLNRRTG